MVFRIFLVIPLSLSIAAEEEKIDPQAPLAIAKIAGACGIMDEMIDFQKKTQLEGGNEFVTRFWQAESARQGKTVEQMSDDCNKAIAMYGQLWKAMEPPKK
jgi:hypothetical protein